MAPKLIPLLPATRSGRTFAVALGLLGAVALAQLLVLGGYLIGGGVPAHHPTAAPVSTRALAVDRPAVETLVVPTPAPAVAPMQAPAVPAENLPMALARPTPAPAPRLQNTPTDLLEQARQLRSRGDTNSALARLREAEVAEPDSPQVVAEMALTYEAMQMPDRAFEQWQRIYNQGEGVGALYNLAESRLHNVPAVAGAPPTGNIAAATAPAPAEGGNFQGPGDTVLKLTDITKEDLEDPAAEQKIALKIVVKNRPGTVIDPDKVRILAYFYDLVDGKSVVQTNAQTEYAWVTPGPINWANDRSEVLQTTYTRLKPAAPPAPAAETPAPKKGGRHGKAAAAATPEPTPALTPAQVRTYVGYCVQLYYDHQLQDVQADPVRLLQQFPAPLTLPAE